MKTEDSSMKDRVQVKEFYKEKASLYDRFFLGFLGWGKQLKSFFQKNEYLHSGMRILDAGCGTGAITQTLFELAQVKDFRNLEFYAFDLSAGMLNIFRKWITQQGIGNIVVAEGDVLKIETLPSDWKDYDLIVTSTMLEYLPRAEIKDALTNLKHLLRNDGTLLVFITKRNLITRWVAGRWWRANLCSKREAQRAFEQAEFRQVDFKKFVRWWSSAILVIEAKK